MSCCNYDNKEILMELDLTNEKHNNREKIMNEIKKNENNEERNFNLSSNIYNNKYLSNLNQHENNEKIFGLENIGLTCYMNSFLQILFHCPKFMDEIEKHICNNSEKIILYNFKQIIKNPEIIENLYNFKSSLDKISSDYSKVMQNDSQKFGIDLIDAIISEIKNDKYSTTESQLDSDSNSIINPKLNYQYYLEKYQYDLIALEKIFTVNEYYIEEKNNKKKINFEHFLYINLFFPTNDYHHLLQKFTLKELLDLKYKNKKKRNRKICNFPDILIITINRAVIEKNTKYYTEVLEFPECLELKEYADKDITKYKNCNYILFGVNKKEGYSINSGHYFSEVKINNIWYKFNDSKVTTNIYFDNVSSEVVGLFYEKKII